MSMDEFDLIAKMVHDKADADAVIIVGLVVEEEMGESIRVTVIATGLERKTTGSKGGLRVI